jgi:hypothetical protein
MMRAFWLVLLLALPAHAAEPLVLEQTIALHNVRGRIDHMAFDPGRKRLIVPNSATTRLTSSMSLPVCRCTGSADCASRRVSATRSVPTSS